jgi:hypothetical protein
MDVAGEQEARGRCTLVRVTPLQRGRPRATPLPPTPRRRTSSAPRNHQVRRVYIAKDNYAFVLFLFAHIELNSFGISERFIGRQNPLRYSISNIYTTANDY